MEESRRTATYTTNGQEPTTPEGPAPQPLDPETGQYGAYWVLSEEERQGGRVRPLRDTYLHVGLKPKYPTRPLTEEEKERFYDYSYVAYEAYPENSPEAKGGAITGRYWTNTEHGCHTQTKMSRPLAETYAKDPSFYGATFCAACRKHLPVQEFVWASSNERVGS